MKKTLKKVAEFIRRHGLLADGARVVVGLSGGPDSVCLSLVLHQLGYEVVGAHGNFHLRGEESMRDERFVTDLCQKQGWVCRKTDFETERYAKEHKISIEMAAREQRYAWFRRIKEECGAEAIAVGHHQEDNAETMLLNLTRGTGIRGMCGIQPRNGDVVRPMLCLTRGEILQELQDCHQEYVTDHTNLENLYARNRIRLDVVPILESINRGALPNMASTMENLNEVLKIYEQSMKEAVAACATLMPNGEWHICIDELLRQPSPISVLHELLHPRGFRRSQLQDALSALHECGKMFVTDKHRRLLVDRQYLILEAEHYPSVEIHQEEVPVEACEIKRNPQYAYFDTNKLHGALTMRTPKEGDTFAPFGMHGKRKLLSDFLSDLKISRFEKERQPLLMDGDEIAWVVGRRSSDLYRVDAQTRRVTILHVSSDVSI